jgi:hypothetical protein
MLPIEQEMFLKKWNQRRSSHLEKVQSYKQQFDFPPEQIGSGWVPNQSGTDPDQWRQSVAEAANYIKQALSQTTDTGIGEALAKVLRAVNSLARVPNGSLQPEKARPNVNGSTESAHVVSSNATSRRSHTVSTSELQKPETFEERYERILAKWRSNSVKRTN